MMKQVTNDIIAVDLWRGLHLKADVWNNAAQNSRNSEIHLVAMRNQIDRKDLQMLCLLENFSGEDWQALCSAVGWTVYGAVAFSWCQDAQLSQVWEGWEASGFPLKPLPEYERPARFINPALMPQTNKLTGMLAAFNNKYPDSTSYSLAICAAIASLKEPLDFDLSTDSLTKATPQIASFLKSRMLQKPDRTAEENALIEVWTKTVKGTEFDVWEDA